MTVKRQYKENYQKLIHVAGKKQIKVISIWQNAKFLDLFSKIHYQSEYKMLYYVT